MTRRRIEITITIIIILISINIQNEIKFVSAMKRTAENNAELVKAQFQHTWSAYMTYAAGHDELLPLNHSYIDYNDFPLLYTPIDAIDTILLMNLTKEYSQAINLICPNNSTTLFEKDMFVSVFDMIIRLLGGLISGYNLSGEKCLLTLAIDLGDRLLPAFTTPPPNLANYSIPWPTLNLLTGEVDKENVYQNPAIVGTSIIEFGALSHLTGDRKYFDLSKKALINLFQSKSEINLVGDCEDINSSFIHLPNPSPPIGHQLNDFLWCDDLSFICAGIDSYYEYLKKCELLFKDKECEEMWNVSSIAIFRYLSDFSLIEKEQLWFKQVNMFTSFNPIYIYDLYSAYFSAVLVLDNQIENAILNQNANYYMWTLHGIEPLQFDYINNTVINGYYSLNPENFESNYYLYVNTKNGTYLDRAEVYLDSLITYCRCNSSFGPLFDQSSFIETKEGEEEEKCVGYSGLNNVETKVRANTTPSYFFAESLKYLYLTFMEGTVEGSPLNFYGFIFNTEAHPIPLSFGSLPPPSSPPSF